MPAATKSRSSKTTKTPPAQTEADVVALRVIRDPEFAKRLDQACDAHNLVPAKHQGRLTWVQRELSSKFKEDVSVETVRKWFSGEAKPRPEKLGKLAQLLEVDVAWLSLGVAPDLQPRERRARNAMADGAVNLVAGLIQMDGGHPAFPEDPASQKQHIDLHAIIRGAKYDIHVSLGEQEGKQISFAVPTNYEALVVLGIVRDGFTVRLYEITPELIAEGHRHGGSINISVDQGDQRLRRIESFKNRL